jgi:DNA-binding NtrC family response regulator
MPINIRLVAATHRSLREEVKLGRFREDLMYRLRVVPIYLPPLRDRREDISLLIWHFIKQHNTANGRKIEKVDPDAMRLLLDYPWHGNIRELHNVVEYTFAVGRGSVLKSTELPPEFREPAQILLVKKVNDNEDEDEDEDEKSAIERALNETKNVNAAAQMLNMSRATFWRKRKQYDL